LENILKGDPKEIKDLSKTRRGTQGYGSTGLEGILNTKNISTVKAIKFHLKFCQHVKNKALQDDCYQLFLNTNLEDKDRISLKGLINFKGRRPISDVEELRLGISGSEHDRNMAGHFELKEILELISHNYYWPKMED
jgi:hypothetical protein